jgi:LPS export ABC transporter protein LptC
MNYNKLLIYAAALGIFACQGSDLSKMESIDKESIPDEISENVELVYSDSGRINRIIKTPLIHKFTTDTNYTLFPKGMQAQFYNKKGKIVTELTCGYGLTSGEDNDRLTFRKNVRITNDKGETLISEEIYLKDDRIHSDSTVYIITPTITLRGTSLDAPRDFSSYKLTSPVGVAKAEALNKTEEK